MKKVFILLFSFLLMPYFVFAETYTNYSPNRYYGYFQTITLGNNNIMMSYYDNGSIDDDLSSGTQILSHGNNSYNGFRFQLSSYMPFVESYCPAGSLACMAYDFGNNYTEVRYFEQDICVSSNKIGFSVSNYSSQDFATNDNSNFIILDVKCNLYDGTVPPNVSLGIQPIYWDWLGNYEGYVAKVFMPIAEWKYVANNNNPYYQVVSTLNVHNYSDYDLYYRFLTTGGLYDHSRYLEFSNDFNLDTMNFDLTFEAVMDGIEVYDTNSQLNYSISKNLINVDELVGNQLNKSNNIYTLTKVDDSNRFSKTGNFMFESGRYYIYCSGSNQTSLSNIRFQFFKNGSTVGYGSCNNSIYLSTYANSVRMYLNDSLSNGYSVSFDKIQIEKGSYFTSYCPFGPTVDFSCISNPVDIGSIDFENGTLFQNMFSILSTPFSLFTDLVNGSNGNCMPLRFSLFNTYVDVPCGSFFWLREDVSSFRTIWNILFGGFIIYKLLIWNIKIVFSLFDPMANSVNHGIELVK